MQSSSNFSDQESYSFEIFPWQGDNTLFEAANVLCECQSPQTQRITETDLIVLCGQCNRPIAAKRTLMRTENGGVCSSQFKNKDGKVNSNEVPKHRYKRIFSLQNYISESEGIVSNPEILQDSSRKKSVKSNFMNQLQMSRPLVSRKTSSNKLLRPIQTGSQHMSIRRY